MVRDMSKLLNTSAMQNALSANGWTQSELAKKVNVSSQSVTNWMRGEGFPRPAALLKLSLHLKLNFDDLVTQPNLDEPIVVFRKKAGAKTKDHHFSQAREKGLLLGRLAKHITNTAQLRSNIAKPMTEYDALQSIASEVRSRIKLSDTSVLKYSHIIKEFKRNGSILVPVLWGKLQNHANALHILLPKKDLTFVFLNLDTKPEDFKFWMAHELAHVYTPELSGSNKGEDFADAFAGALLFPKPCAELVYREVQTLGSGDEIAILSKYAKEYHISIFSVFEEVNKFANALGVALLSTKSLDIHKIRSRNKVLMSELLFKPSPPEAMEYISLCEKEFDSTFFDALRQMIGDGVEAPYIQQVLGVSKLDSIAIHQELSA